MEEISDASKQKEGSFSPDSSMFNQSIQHHSNNIKSFLSLQL